MERYNDEKLIDAKNLADLAKAYSSVYPSFEENAHIIKRRERQTTESDTFKEITRSFEQKQVLAKPSMGVSMPLYHAPNAKGQHDTTRIELLLAEILGELRAIRRALNASPPTPQPSPTPPQPREPSMSNF